MPPTTRVNKVKALLLTGIVLGLAACGLTSLPPAQDAEPLEPETYTYREVGGQALSAHVFAPTVRSAGDEPTSAVLLFHGGGWSVGSPEWTFDAARRFAAHGMVAIPIRYRLSEGGVTPSLRPSPTYAPRSGGRASTQATSVLTQTSSRGTVSRRGGTS
jgi:hypothetical protein